MFPNLTGYSVIGYDTETTGLSWAGGARVFGFSIAAGKDEWYFDIRQTPRAVEWFNDQMRRYRGVVATHNVSFDFHMSRVSGINIPLEQMSDTCIRAALIDEHLYSYELDQLARRYLGTSKMDIVPKLADIFGGRRTRNVQMRNLPKAPVELVAEYAMPDARIAHDLWWWQEDEIRRQGLEQIVAFEAQCMPWFVRNEGRGVAVDIGAAETALISLDASIAEIQRTLDDSAGFEVNVAAREHMLRLFEPQWVPGGGGWVARDGTALPSTGGGQASLAAEALLAMKDEDAKRVLEIRKMIRVRDVFVKGHILSNAVNGRVYPTINQTKGESGGTGTGRLSMQSPALQQISKRDKRLMAIVRPLFVPDEGHHWSMRDWSQSDFRWFAHYVNVPSINAQYEKGNPDFHSIIAELAGIPRDPEYAGGPNAKQVNLGLIFGMGEGRMAEEMGLPWEWKTFSGGGRGKIAGPEAKQVFDKYHRAVPGVKSFLKSAAAVARNRGYVFSTEGRHLRFPHGEGTHKAGGLLFQSGTAEMLKRKYLELNQFFEAEGVGSVILTVHDEINTNIPIGHERLDREVCRIMQDVRNCRIPFRTSAGMGVNWYDAITKEKSE